MRNLLDTMQARDWLREFANADKPAARLLLESLTLVSHTDFQRTIAELILQQAVGSKRVISLFAVREVDPPPVTKSTCNIIPLLPPTPNYFDQMDPQKRPDAVGSGVGVGSEGIIAHLIRDIAKQAQPGRFIDHSSIHSMRSTKTRKVILVNDFIGSGKQVTDFVEAFVNHRTIKSWHSRGHLSVEVCAYAGTLQGVQNVRRHRYVDAVHCACICAKGSRFWSQRQRHEVMRICEDYASRTSRPRIPFGFRDAFTLTVFEHKVPNNTPPILWAKSKRWPALFEPRPGIGFSTWPEPITVQEKVRRTMLSIGQPKLASVATSRYDGPMGEALVLLAALAKRYRRLIVLSEVLGISYQKLEELLASCIRSGWIDLSRRITKRGLAVLESAREHGHVSEDAPVFKPGFYFPMSLRAARGSI
jgi:hypothetical protein